MIRITDNIGNDGTVTCEAWEAAGILRGWFSEAPAEVLKVIDELQESLNRDEYTEGYEIYLGITIENI